MWSHRASLPSPTRHLRKKTIKIFRHNSKYTIFVPLASFRQVMTYHDALATQLRGLVALVRTLRARLAAVDESAIKVGSVVIFLKKGS